MNVPAGISPVLCGGHPGVRPWARRLSAAAVALVLWGALASRAAAEWRVVGSDLLGAAFTRELGEFARRNGPDLALGLTGTRPGAAALARGEAELGLLVLPAGETPPRGPFISLAIAYQPVAVIVPAVSTWREVTVAQLVAAFGADDSGPATPDPAPRLVPVLLDAADGLTAQLFQRVALGGAPFRANLPRVTERVALADRLRTLENGCALVPFVPAAGAPWRALPVVSRPGTPAVPPTLEALEQGTYPWSLVVHLVLRRADAPRLRPLLRFLLTEEGAAALHAADFLPPSAATRQRLLAEWEQMH